MVEKLRFEKYFQQSSFHNPLLGGKLDVQELELRRDPLTGRQSVFNANLGDKAALFIAPSDLALIERLARESEARCFLCGDQWQQATPLYPESLVPGGRVEVGEAVLFPNLFPVSPVHAVIRVGSNHHLPLQDLSCSLIDEAFQASKIFIELLFQTNETVRYLTLNGNYLGPAGASIHHPHFQMLGSDLPWTHLEELLAGSAAYREAHGVCYWTHLVEREEELGDRFIGRTGSVSWLTSFSPQGTNEVLGILTERRDLREMSPQDFSDLAEGFAAVLRGYAALGISTFNFTLYSGPLGIANDAFRCFLRVISRQNVSENYRTDDYFLQKLLRTELILNTPENLASALRSAFQK